MKRFITFLSLMVVSAAAYAERKTSVNVTGGVEIDQILKVIAALLIVLVVIVVGAWIARKYLSSKTFGGLTLSLVGGLSLGGKDRIVVVEVEGEKLVLGVSQGGIIRLHKIRKNPDKYTEVLVDDISNNHDDFIEKLNDEIRRGK